MRTILLCSLIVILSGGCVTSDLEPAHPRYSKKNKSKPILSAEAPHTGPVQPSSGTKPAPGPQAVTGSKPEASSSTPIKHSVTELKPAPVLRKGPLVPPTRLNRRDASILVRIPGGKYLVPLNPPSHHRMTDNSRGLQEKILPEFYIDVTEVTVEQFKLFEPDYDETVFTGGEACPQCPAMGIDWRRANNYCLWADKRLPTEEEWEAAARGQTSRLVPWEGGTVPKRANLLGEEDGYLGPAPVGSFPAGASPAGALDMIGNVWEWVATPVPTPALQPASTQKNAAASENPGTPPPAAHGKQAYLLKGGSWSSPPILAGISIRNPVDGSAVNSTFGFRCAQSAH